MPTEGSCGICYGRVKELCDRYADADIALATLDHRHFGTMRPRHVEALTLMPE
jgi:hypothetical protein